MTGWGYTREDGNGSSPDILHQVEVPIMNNENCIKDSKYSEGELKHISILPTMLCAGNRNGIRRDACNVSYFNCYFIPIIDSLVINLWKF